MTTPNVQINTGKLFHANKIRKVDIDFTEVETKLINAYSDDLEALAKRAGWAKRTELIRKAAPSFTEGSMVQVNIWTDADGRDHMNLHFHVLVPLVMQTLTAREIAAFVRLAMYGSPKPSHALCEQLARSTWDILGLTDIEKAWYLLEAIQQVYLEKTAAMAGAFSMGMGKGKLEEHLDRGDWAPFERKKSIVAGYNRHGPVTCDQQTANFLVQSDVTAEGFNRFKEAIVAMEQTDKTATSEDRPPLDEALDSLLDMFTKTTFTMYAQTDPGRSRTVYCTLAGNLHDIRAGDLLVKHGRLVRLPTDSDSQGPRYRIATHEDRVQLAAQKEHAQRTCFRAALAQAFQECAGQVETFGLRPLDETIQLSHDGYWSVAVQATKHGDSAYWLAAAINDIMDALDRLFGQLTTVYLDPFASADPALKPTQEQTHAVSSLGQVKNVHA